MAGHNTPPRSATAGGKVFTFFVLMLGLGVVAARVRPAWGTRLKRRQDPVQRRILDLLDGRALSCDEVLQEYSDDLDDLFAVLNAIGDLLLVNRLTYLPGGGATVIRSDQEALHQPPAQACRP